MDTETKQGCGCLAAVIIIPMIGFWLRTQNNWGHFGVMVGIEILAVVLAVWAIYGLTEKGFWFRLSGAAAGIYAISCIIGMGSFLFTGNYEASIKFFTWKWGETVSNTSAAPTSAPPTAVAASTPSSSTQTEENVQTGNPPSDQIQPEPGAWGWLLTPDFTEEQILSTLNELWSQTPEQAKATVASLQRAAPLADSDQNKQAFDFLQAVALERAEDVQSAVKLYNQVIQRNKQDQYATSASFRVANNGSWLADSIYQNMMIYTPEQSGWFLIDNKWELNTSGPVANQVMFKIHSDEILFEFFQYVRSKSPWPTNLSYLFIIITLVFGIKLLALPLYFRQAKWLVSGIWSESESKQFNRILWMVMGVDLIFLFWAINTFGIYTPQLIRDNANFMWIANVAKPDWGILFLFLVIYWFYYWVEQGSISRQGFLFWTAWWLFFGWFMMSIHLIFYTTLCLATIILTLLLRMIWKIILSLQT